MTENQYQFWWASLHGRDRPDVVEVTFEDGKPAYVCEAGAPSIAADDFDRCQVRLIERVLPAGRAAAAVEKLESIVSSSWHVDQATEEAMKVIAILQDGENRA
ncbi:hypothetical protein [Methylorubrum sp. SB2]|uniref:hypothetical protein n=1 Tax=Methylorubrum subtropicum TaxID=3138812 RepID=UPI00313BA5E6